MWLALRLVDDWLMTASGSSSNLLPGLLPVSLFGSLSDSSSGLPSGSWFNLPSSLSSSLPFTSTVCHHPDLLSSNRLSLSIRWRLIASIVILVR